jgi:hypothetical protein
MRSSVASILSITVVLGAGALAAAANMQVFSGSGDAATRTVAVAEAASTGSGVAGVTPAGNRADAVGEQAFRVGPAGTVTLDATGGLHLVAIDPAVGWRLTDSDAGSSRVEVRFASGSRELTAVAVLAADGIHVAVDGPGGEPGDEVDDHSTRVGLPADAVPDGDDDD